MGGWFEFSGAGAAVMPTLIPSRNHPFLLHSRPNVHGVDDWLNTLDAAESMLESNPLQYPGVYLNVLGLGIGCGDQRSLVSSGVLHFVDGKCGQGCREEHRPYDGER